MKTRLCSFFFLNVYLLKYIFILVMQYVSQFHHVLCCFHFLWSHPESEWADTDSAPCFSLIPTDSHQCWLFFFLVCRPDSDCVKLCWLQSVTDLKVFFFVDVLKVDRMVWHKTLLETTPTNSSLFRRWRLSTLTALLFIVFNKGSVISMWSV